MLRDYQVDALNAIDDALKTEKFVLLSAIMGAGKTVMVCRLINKYPSKKFLVLAHKQELVEQFHRTLLEMTEVTDIGIVCAGLGQRKFGRVTIGTIQTFFNVADYSGCDLLVIDECFIPGTKIDGIAIEKISAGDMVSSYNHTNESIELKRITRVYKNKYTDDLIRINGNVICTKNHPFFVDNKYVQAYKLKIGDALHRVTTKNKGAENEMPRMRRGNCFNQLQKRKVKKRTHYLLFKRMRDEGEHKAYYPSKQNITQEGNDGKKSDVDTWSEREDDPGKESKWDFRFNKEQQDGKRKGNASPAIHIIKKPVNFLQGLVRRISGSNCAIKRTGRRKTSLLKNEWPPNLLQSGYRKPKVKNSNRNRWERPLFKKKSRQKEGGFLKIERVESLEILKQGSAEWLSAMQGQDYVFNLEVETNNNYFANNYLVHNCHKVGEDGQYAQLIERLSPSRVLGVTATPYRLGHGYIYGKHCLGTNFWPKLNHSIGYDALMKAGYLVPLKGKVAKAVSYDIDIEQINKNGDYVLQELGYMMSKQVYLQSAVDAINEHCKPYDHICVFCTTIQHAQMLHTMLPDSTIVHSELTAAERAENMRLWMTGKKRIITSINILSEGFDWPPLECLVMARPTQSTALYLQSVGRVLRIHNGKDHGFLLDLTDNTRRFGTDLDNVFVHVPKTVEKMVAKERNNEKICPACGKEIHKKLKVCPFCQYLYEELIADKQIGEFEDVEFVSSSSFRVIEMYDDIWQSKKSGKWLYRIRLECENGYSASVWLCFPDDGYAGFAVTQGKKWWDKFTIGAPAPESAMSALEQRDLLWKPDFAILDVSDRYPNVKDVGFDVTPFRVEAA